MDVSFFEIGGSNNLQFSSQHLLEIHIYIWIYIHFYIYKDENEPWLLIGIPNRDPFLVAQCLEEHSASSHQHVKKLLSLREGLHVMMQCCMRQHCADRYWLHEHTGGHASWREPTIKKLTKESTTLFVQAPVCRWNVQKMQS